MCTCSIYCFNYVDVTLPGYSVRAQKNVDLKEKQIMNQQNKQAKKKKNQSINVFIIKCEEISWREYVIWLLRSDEPGN